MTSRLLTIAQAAEYLSIPQAELKRVGKGRIVIGTRVRWDRVALDAWLDEAAGLRPPANGAGEPSLDAEAAEYFENKRHAAGAR